VKGLGCGSVPLLLLPSTPDQSKLWYALAVKFLNAGSGVLSAVTIILLLVIAIVVIAPQVDLEDGVLGVEQILYALLMALASIVALRVIRTRGLMIVPAASSAFPALGTRSLSSAFCRLLC
jgi:hypothetical protein